LPVFKADFVNVKTRSEALASEVEVDVEAEAEAEAEAEGVPEESLTGLVETDVDVTEGVVEGQEQKADVAEVVFLQLKSTTPRRLTRVSSCLFFIKIPISCPDEMVSDIVLL
jgi:hypothetical protein